MLQLFSCWSLISRRTSDLEQDGGALGCAGLAPRRCCGVGGIERLLDVVAVRSRRGGEDLPRRGRHDVHVLSVDRRDEGAADELQTCIAKVQA